MNSNDLSVPVPPSPLDLSILRVSYLRGPNMWTYREVIEAWLDLGELEQWPSHKLPGFVERLLAVLPQVGAHHCGLGVPNGFLQRLQTGTWMGHVLEHIIIELIEMAGMEAGFGQTRETNRPGVYRMVFRVPDETVGRTALAAGHALLYAVLNDQAFDLDEAVTRIRIKIDECYLGPSTAHIVASATRRAIPHIRLNKGNLVQLGYGARQNRIWTAETDLTSAIAEGIASDKDMTKDLLRGCGVPVPEGEVVDSPAQAWEAAQELGLPVVVKPLDGNRGRGVMLNLKTQTDIEAAWHVAHEEGSGVMVERYIHGDEHRVLVVGGKVVAATRGESAWVSGDGKSSILELIELQLNSDPRRGNADIHPLETIKLLSNNVMLANLQRQGLQPESVIETDRRVLISANGNHSVECTSLVHPEVAHSCTLAARIIGLDIAGIDLVCADISQPLHAQGGAIVEVNAGPSLLMHLNPAQGAPQPVGDAIVDHLFPAHESGRIPIVGVAGTEGTTQIARLVAWLLQLSGTQVGLACQDGLFVGSRHIDRHDAAHWEAGQRLLINRNVEAAVFENGPLSLLTEGLAYDRCNIGIVTDSLCVPAMEEHLMTEPAQRFKVLRTQVDVVRKDGAAVLNANDSLVLDMAELCDGEVLLYAEDGQHPALLAHRESGGRVVYQRGSILVQGSGAHSIDILDIEQDLRPASRSLPTPVLLAAVAAAWALGLDKDLIATGLETFEPTATAAIVLS
ncbi:MAG: cyanophycin synthetase [Burkholderiaceae bacterium]